MVFYSGGSTKALQYAITFLRKAGTAVEDRPSQQVTHLLLDVPSFGPERQLRGGGKAEALLEQLSDDVIVCGGNLAHPALSAYRKIDLLQDEGYLASNAYITAECALDVALPYLTVTLRTCPVLIVGWGRIGKCLGQLLTGIGADVTLAARKASTRAMAGALGYHTAAVEELKDYLPQFRLIFNTAPEMVLNRELTALCREDCVLIDLASRAGIDNENVIVARGLPGLHFPESSGILIAKSCMRLIKEEDT